MLRLKSEIPCLDLERASSSRTTWCADYWRGECPAQGVVVEGVIEVKKPSMRPKIYKKRAKTNGFLHLLTLKMPKTPFITLK
jgi:hypothetical protein